jgi:hypothetical protein
MLPVRRELAAILIMSSVIAAAGKRGRPEGDAGF